MSGVENLVFIETILDCMVFEWQLNLLKDNTRQSADKMGLAYSMHTACVVKEWLLYNMPYQLQTPPQYPDLNPIESYFFTKV